MKQPGDDYTVGDWIDAMQSGRYNMIQGSLGKAGSGEHCALGVLTEEVGTQPLSFIQGADLFTRLRRVGIEPNTVIKINDGSSRFKNRKYRAVIKYIKEETPACRDTVIGKVKGNAED